MAADYLMAVRYLSSLIGKYSRVLSVAQVILLLLNTVAGFLVGSQFLLANEMLLREGEVGIGSVGFLYASDLFGAFLGSIAVSVVLIPVLGIINTCLLAALLKLGSLLLSVVLSEQR
jgi:spermidine synthase